MRGAHTVILAASLSAAAAQQFPVEDVIFAPAQSGYFLTDTYVDTGVYATSAAWASIPGCEAACASDAQCVAWMWEVDWCGGVYAAGAANGGLALVDAGSGYFAGTATRSVAWIALWIAFAFTGAATLLFLLLSYARNVKPEARLTYFLVTAINLITALAYLIQALGDTAYFPRPADYLPRPFLWLRYAAWAAVAPLTVFVLGLLSGAHWVSIFWVSFASVVSVAGLFAATINTGFNATWPIFAFALVAGFPVAYGLAYHFRAAAYKLHAEIGKLYDVVGLGSLVLYAGYAIVWGTSEGGNVTTFDQEVIVYAVLDIVTKAVFGVALVYGREAIARYGSFLGGINTGVDYDFPIARSTVTSSAINYSTEGGHAIVYGEHRDLAFAQLHGATNTALTTKQQ